MPTNPTTPLIPAKKRNRTHFFWMRRIAKRSKSRREFLQWSLKATGIAMGKAMGVLVVGQLVQACQLWQTSEIKIGNMAQLEAQKQLIGKMDDAQIFVQQGADNQPFALDLTCSHKQCTVKWDAENDGFRCPCHKGRYDKTGKVLSGKPPKPLRKLKVEIRNQEIWVLNS